MAEILGEKTTKDKTIFLVNCTVWSAMIIFAFHACTHMVAAGDTWVAMACGRHFVNHGVDTVEPFSFNSHKAGPTEEELEKFPQWLRPSVKKWHPTGWVNQNWLTQVIFYRLVTTFGSEQEPAYSMLVAWKFIINLVVIICLYFSSRLLGGGRLISALLICCAMYISRSFIDIRPAVFSNALVPLYILILLLAANKKSKYIYFIVPLLVFWSNVHGGYLYAFIIIVPFWLYSYAAQKLNWNVLAPVSKGLLGHTFFAGLLSFIAMVIFNPYHLTNLTHTFIITVSKHAKEWKNVNEWHSAFELSNPVGESLPFLILFFTGLFVVVVWFLFWAMKPKNIPTNDSQDSYKWPYLPVIYLFIALFTCAMAIRSRRFIPIASYAFVPILAVMLTQICEICYARMGKVFSKSMPVGVVCIAALSMLTATLILGTVWVVKFHKIYLAPWPVDSEKTSVFMRMTASYAKPFRACDFIKANKLSGHMLNYWTEGGFVAYSQEADQQTGEIPLKLFMDGRAQAAYDISMFQEYNLNILSGGDKGRALAALSRSRQASPSDIQQGLAGVSQYLDDKLTSYDVWLILMPSNQQNGLFMKAMKSRVNWKMVYSDHSQVMLVNINDQRGKSLLEGVFNGATIFPDENYRKMIKAAYMSSSQPEKAFELASQAFNDTKSSTALSYLLNSARTQQVEDKVYKLCKSLVSDFLANQDEYKKQDGFVGKQSNVIMALNYIGKSASKREPAKATTYSKLAEQLIAQRKDLMKEYNW